MSSIKLNLDYAGLDYLVRESCAVVVKKLPGEVNLRNITHYLSSYENEDIRRAELIEYTDVRSKYKLETTNPVTFNLIIFVNEIFSLFDENKANAYLGVGYILLPTLGSEKLNPEIYLDINWNIIKSTASIHFTPDLSSEPEILLSEYEKSSIGNNQTMVNKSELKDYGINFLPSTTSNISSVMNIPQGILSNNRLYKISNLEITVAEEESIILDTSYFSYLDNEWIEFKMMDGSRYMSNVTKYPVMEIRDLKYTPSTETWRIKNDFELESIITPDKVLWKSGNKWRSVEVSEYLESEYTDVSELNNTMTTFKEFPLHILPGVDRVSTNINLVFSDKAASKNWYLQSTYSNVLQRNTYLNSLVYKYNLIEHNGKFMYINESSNLTSSHFIADYQGNRLNGATYHKLLVDGSLICKVRGYIRYYETDLRSYVILSDLLDFYKIYPSLYSKELINSSPINIKSLILVRDRYLNLDNLNLDNLNTEYITRSVLK